MTSGILVCSDAGLQFGVEDTQKIKSDVFGHHGTLQTQGTLKVGDAGDGTWWTWRRARMPPSATTASRT